MTTLKTCIRTITYLSDIGCLEIQGASLVTVWEQNAYTFDWLADCVDMTATNASKIDPDYGLGRTALCSRKVVSGLTGRFDRGIQTIRNGLMQRYSVLRPTICN